MKFSAFIMEFGDFDFTYDTPDLFTQQLSEAPMDRLLSIGNTIFMAG